MIYCEQINGVIGYRHHAPFDEKHGLGKTQEELEQTGFLVDTLPVAEEQVGKEAVLKVNVETKEIYYDYIERPLTLEETGIKKIDKFFQTAAQAYDDLDKQVATLEEVQVAKILELKEGCTAAIHEGFISTSTGYEFGYNDMDQSNFTKRMVTIVAGSPGPFKWKSRNAGVVDLTKGDFINVITEAEGHQLVLQTRYWELEAMTLAVTTKEEVDSISW